MRISLPNQVALWTLVLGTGAGVLLFSLWYGSADRAAQERTRADLAALAGALARTIDPNTLAQVATNADSAEAQALAKRLKDVVAADDTPAPLSGAFVLIDDEGGRSARLGLNAPAPRDANDPSQRRRFASPAAEKPAAPAPPSIPGVPTPPRASAATPGELFLPRERLIAGLPFRFEPPGSEGALSGYVNVLAPITGADGARRGWLGLQAHRADLTGPTIELFTTARLGMLASAGVSLVVGVVASRVATRRLPRLVHGLGRLGAGDLTQPIDVHSNDELGDMARAANQARSQLEERKNLRHSLSIARDVQRALLPEQPPRVPGLDIASFCVYCDQTGGDYFDYLPLGPADAPGRDGWALVVGDVTGHGVPAALLMATARAILRANPLTHETMHEFVGVVNRELCVQGQTGRFMTLFLLAVEPGMKGLRWVSAGHDAALVYDPLEQRFTELAGEDLPLGVEPECRFTTCRRTGPLAQGQIVLIGTDGIWELRNAADNMFGKDNLKRVIRKHANQSADEIGRALLAALDAHRGEMPSQDDITFMVFKVTG